MVTLIENSFDPATSYLPLSSSELTLMKGKEDSFWMSLLQPEVIQPLIIPIAVFVVIIYQFFFKTREKTVVEQMKDIRSMSKEERDQYISDKF